jgi:hypothetical protein
LASHVRTSDWKSRASFFMTVSLCSAALVPVVRIFLTRPQLPGRFAQQAVKASSLAKAKSLGQLVQENENFLISAQPAGEKTGV